MLKLRSVLSIRRELVILTVALVVASAYFWSASRYPALNQKSSKSGQENLTEILTERPVFKIEKSAPLWEKVIRSTGNWLAANAIGMMFGIFIAALVFTMLGYFSKPDFKNPFLNTFLGSLIGSPLGLCVNCAAPVAKGFYAGGVNGGLALSVMFSSPKFNSVILAMAFSLFPFYLVIIKYSFTLIFIFLCLPLLSQYLLSEQSAEDTGSFQPASSPVSSSNSWWDALVTSTKALFSNLWYISYRVVPLMFLAGFLGALAAHLFTFEGFIIEHITIGGILLVSAVGLFLPMPIGVDLLLAEMLFQAGGALGYVAILLFSLGIYSVYSFFIVWKYFSPKMASAILATLVILSICIGYATDYYSKIRVESGQKYYREAMAYIKSNVGSVPQVAKNIISTENSFISKAPTLEFSPIYSDSGLSITKFPFLEPANESDKLFKKNSGKSFGIQEEFIHYDELYEPFFYGRALTSGDINNDGWEDIALGLRKGVAIYLNDGGAFHQISVDLGKLNQSSVHVVAFVDIDNDGWNDLFLSTYASGNYFVINDSGSFTYKNVIEAPDSKPAVTMAVSFADINQDGYLDFYLGNWGFGYYARNEAPPMYTRNTMVYNKQLRFEIEHFEKKSGETLSVLFTDFNNDGTTDLMVGNDFASPDRYFIGGANGFKIIKNKDNLFQVSPYYTMGVTTADINNDLLLDSYVTGLNFDGPIKTEREAAYNDGAHYDNDEYESYCANYTDADSKAKCLEMIAARNILPKAEPKRIDITQCEALKEDLTSYRECLALAMAFESLNQERAELCDQIEAEFATQKAFCNNYFSYKVVHTPEEEQWKQLEMMESSIPQVKGQNALHLGNSDNGLNNITEKNVLNNTGWTWNARFADLDNDEWQDLFIVNGCYEHQKIYNMNYFFKNINGKRFLRSQIEAGLDDVGITHSFLYIDLDHDGDQDIITRSAVGQIYVYQNNTFKNHSITFRISDRTGNRNGIGAKIYVSYGEKNERTQMRELNLGGGFMSYQIPQAHFGLGEYDHINSMRVEWPDGTATIFNQQLETGAKYIIERRTNELSIKNSL